MKKCIFLLFILAFLGGSSVQAMLVSSDWKSTGDDLITRDSEAGLEWLDVTLTTLKDYNQIYPELGAGGIYEGFRYTTNLEFEELINHANGDIRFVQELIGITYALDDPFTETYGQLADYAVDNTGDKYHWVGVLNSWDYRDLNGEYHFMLGPAECCNNDVDIGSYLVKEVSVPEPATAFLVGSALLGFEAFRRKFRD